MAERTTYLVESVYLTRDQSSGTIGRIDRASMRAARSSGALRRTLLGVGTALVGGSALVAGKRALIDFNANMQQARIQMAGMIQLNKGGDWTKNLKDANNLVGQLQKRAKASVGTTKDFVQMAAQITRPIAAAGMGMKDLENFTTGAVIASKAFGIEAGMAARDIEAALMGQLRSVDRFSRSLLEPLGFAGEEGREKFNAMSAGDRASTLRTALTQPAIAEMAKAQEKSFSGVMSTFQDNLQITLGKVGLPLFKALTKELQNWNKWLDANGHRVEQMARTLGQSLVKAFNVIKDVGGFFVEHAGTLANLAKIWIGLKVANMAGGLASGALSMGGGALQKAGARGLMGMGGGDEGGRLGRVRSLSAMRRQSRWNKSLERAGLRAAKMGSALQSAASLVGKFAGALGIAYGVLQGFKAAWSFGSELGASLGRKRDEFQSRREVFSHMVEGARKGALGGDRQRGLIRQGSLLRYAREQGIVNGDSINIEKLAKHAGIGGMGEAMAELKAALALQKEIANAYAASNVQAQIRLAIEQQQQRNAANFVNAFWKDMDKGSKRFVRNLVGLGDQVATSLFGLGAFGMGKKEDKKEQISVTINKVEIPAKDPDRFLIDLGRIASKHARAPRQAKAALGS